MLPKELIKTIFSFQERFFYFLKRNTIQNIEKINQTMRKFRPKYISWRQTFQVILPINKYKDYYLEKNNRGKFFSWQKVLFKTTLELLEE
jgi:hypothetical protein